jgi:hypothetical protein
MDMAVNIPGSKKLENTRVQFLEPVDDDCSKIINDRGRIELVSNGRLSTWK